MMYLQIWKSVIVAFFMITGMLGGCEPTTEPKVPEPYFKPGEYGGDPLEGTEHLYNFQLSPDGTQMALIRAYTPGEPLAPRDQLWILNADGAEPKLIGYNLGGPDWSPDGEKLAVTFFPGAPYTYVFTVKPDSMKAKQWTGFKDSFFTKQTASNAQWFPDDRRLLISVWGKAYQQPYERGLYILDSFDSSVQGPLVEVASGGFLGNYTNYLIARKYLKQGEPLNGNYIKYNFSTHNWNWITTFPEDSLDWVEFPFPNPVGTELVVARHLDNAWQLFMMDSNGENIQQLTELGGSEVKWSKDGRYVYFNRDVHKAPGARYIPHYYELTTEDIQPVWPELPDSVPQFPPLESQSPIDFNTVVQQNTNE